MLIPKTIPGVEG